VECSARIKKTELTRKIYKQPLEQNIKMTHIQTVDPNELISRAAEELKKQKLVEPTEWSKFVKTGHHKERLPDNPDWWYYRAAAILRSIYKLGPIGTQKLRTKYGGKKNRGHKPEHFYKASGSIIRKILQQLEKSELIKQTEKGIHKGRMLTPKGISFLDKIAVQISKEATKDRKAQ
jgi:small subunit ribosomal protein S19e